MKNEMVVVIEEIEELQFAIEEMKNEIVVVIEEIEDLQFAIEEMKNEMNIVSSNWRNEMKCKQ